MKPIRPGKETLKIGEDTALSKGYSFAFQVIGYFAWEKNPDDLAKGLADAKDYVYEFAYWKIWSELSGKDRDVVAAIARVPSGEIAEVRKILRFTSNQFNPYRSRLLKAGIIKSPADGIVEFALPWFGDFAEYVRKMEML